MKSFLIAYFSVGIAGSCCIVGAVPFYKAARVQNGISGAQGLLGASQPEGALKQLEAVREWTAAYPSLAAKWHCEAVRCHVRLDNYDAAKESAERVRTHDYSADGKSGGLWSALRSAGAWIANLSLQKRGYGAEISDWTGYEVMITEYYHAGDSSDIARVAADILSLDPDNPIGTRAREYASGKRRLPFEEPAAEPVSPAPDGPADVAGPPDSDPPRYWGVVKIDKANAYMPSGDIAGTVPAGTLADICGTMEVEGMKLLMCSLINKGRRKDGLLMDGSDLDIRDGPLNRASPREQALRIRQVELVMELAKTPGIAESETRTQAGANPHAAKYEAARKEYDGFKQKARSIQKKWEKSTGGARMRYQDQLRAMKDEGMVLQRNFKAAETEYLAWERKHGGKNDTRKPDDKAQKLERELKAVRRELEQIARLQ